MRRFLIRLLFGKRALKILNNASMIEKMEQLINTSEMLVLDTTTLSENTTKLLDIYTKIAADLEKNDKHVKELITHTEEVCQNNALLVTKLNAWLMRLSMEE